MNVGVAVCSRFGGKHLAIVARDMAWRETMGNNWNRVSTVAFACNREIPLSIE